MAPNPASRPKDELARDVRTIRGYIENGHNNRPAALAALHRLKERLCPECGTSGEHGLGCPRGSSPLAGETMRSEHESGRPVYDENFKIVDWRFPDD